MTTHYDHPARIMEAEALRGSWESIARSSAAERDELRAENSKLKGQLEEVVGALETIAELAGDCVGQKFNLTRWQAAQYARRALSKLKEAGS